MKAWDPGEAMAAIAVVIVFTIVGTVQGHMGAGIILGTIVAVGTYATMTILDSRRHRPPNS